MIDTFSAATTGKNLILKRNGAMTLITEPQPGKKPKLIDMAFGNFNQIADDLKSQGYNITIL